MKKKNILLTGGAGYIGSHCTLQLIEAGFNVIVIDNLTIGLKKLLPSGVTFYQADIANKEVLDQICAKYKIEACIHLAASTVVSESVTNPLKYYINNTVKTLKLLENLRNNNINKMIFSSTAAVYGQPKTNPIMENSPLLPINPYGNSKKIIEEVMQDIAFSDQQFKYIALRYFNVAGADAKMRCGQISKNATHLIKVAAEVAIGKRAEIKIHGTNYNTPDGTCIRDYIHVSDLANAHLDALNFLLNNGDSSVFNVGYNKGFSVKEVLNIINKITGGIKITEGTRRDGDPDTLIADSSEIKKILKWEPKFNDLETICRSAIEWEQKLQF